MEPKHDLLAFFKACQEGTKAVVVLATPERDARIYFKLQTKEDLLYFIADCGLKQLRFLKTAPISHIQVHGLQHVDEYDFEIDGQPGYLAFGVNEITHRWIIKSFHLQEVEKVFPEMGNAYRLALGKKGEWIKKQITGE